MERPIEVDMAAPVPFVLAAERLSSTAWSSHEPGADTVRLTGGTVEPLLSEMVRVKAGAPEHRGSTVRRELTITPKDHDRLLGKFDGWLELRPDARGSRVLLAGVYQVAVDGSGRFGEGLVAHHLARRALTGLVEQIGARLAQPESAGRRAMTRPASPGTKRVGVTP